MSKLSMIDSLARMMQVIKCMASDGGATVTEISRDTGIDRWTVKNMIDDFETMKGLNIEEFQSEEDKRQTIYHVPKDSLWSLTLPGISLSDEEGLLLAIMFSQSGNEGITDTSENLRKKLSMFHMDNYEILTPSTAAKVQNKEMQAGLLAILKAINEGKCISFKYQPVRREITSYQLMPLGVFRYDAGYYLAAQKLPDGEYRTFGLERLVEIPSIIDWNGQLPEKVNYKERFNDPFGPFGHKAEFEAVLKFDAFHGFFPGERKWPEDKVSFETLEDESIIMRVKTHTYPGIKKWVLGFGSGVEVLEPDWFRQYIARDIGRARDQYPDVQQEEKQ